ncbi:MAG: hypothetical protein Q4A67_05295 [Aerococcus sp.]|nr:hypothetical protein [Aerococcus sp.]
MALRKKFEETISALTIFIMTFLVSLSWGENPFSTMVSGHDTSIFIYLGKAITQGARPYIDVTDHKGPVIFLLNALGWKLPHVHPSGGIYFVEFTFFLVFLTVIYKTARLWVPRLPALLAVFFASLATAPFTDGGNLTELYALPFISLILYYFVLYFKEQKLPNYSYYLMGFGTLFIFGLRANMIVALAPLFIVLLIGIAINEKSWQALLAPLLKLIIGGLIFLIPLIIYLFVNGSLMAAIQDSIITNMIYAEGTNTQLSAILAHIKSLNSYGMITLMLVSCGVIVMTTENKLNNWLCIGTLGFSYLLMLYAETLSGRAYSHYFMPLFPYYGLLVGYLLSRIKALQNPIIYALTLSVIFWNLHAPFVSWYTNAYSLNTTASLSEMKQQVEETKGQRQLFPDQYVGALSRITNREEVTQVTKLVDHLTTPDDRIYAHRLGGWYYLTTDRDTATRYFSLPAMTLNVDSEIGQTFFQEMEHNKPKVIILPTWAMTPKDSTDTVDGRLPQYVEAHYHEVKRFDKTIVFERKE